MKFHTNNLTVFVAILLWFLAPLSLKAQTKPYNNARVYVTETSVFSDSHGVPVRFIFAKGDRLTFRFQCNGDQPSCMAPQLNAYYSLSVPQEGFYTCDNYLLGSIAVCLDDVAPVTP